LSSSPQGETKNSTQDQRVSRPSNDESVLLKEVTSVEFSQYLKASGQNTALKHLQFLEQLSRTEEDAHQLHENLLISNSFDLFSEARRKSKFVLVELWGQWKEENQ
jgi:hypothetical protein